MEKAVAPIVFRLAVAASVLATVILAPVPGAAQLGQSMQTKIAVDVAHDLASKIQGESCSDFAATMHQLKGNSSSPGHASSIMKKNPSARTQFVNIVAGPMLNKMIDCGMMSSL
jgi:hypothetical protein